MAVPDAKERQEASPRTAIRLLGRHSWIVVGVIVLDSSLGSLCQPPSQNAAALPAHPDVQREEIVLPGEVPSPINPPPGCRFHPRCPFVKPECSQVEPVLTEVASDHKVSCHLFV
jgi:oligopeptide/dipeptide ABC transporter ATP-binding protein